MVRNVFIGVGMAALVGAVAWMHPASGQADGEATSIGIKLPPDYRQWQLISVAHEEGKLDDFRAILGNDIAVRAAKAGTLPYPDGAIIARLAWGYDPLPESSKAFGHAQSFVAGSPKNGLQLMVRDSKKFASTGGWGYAQFDGGKPSATARPEACFACHQTVETRDYVFNRYAP